MENLILNCADKSGSCSLSPSHDLYAIHWSCSIKKATHDVASIYLSDVELLCINQWQPMFTKEGFCCLCFLYKKGILLATFNLFSNHYRGFFVVVVFTGGCWHNVSFLCPQIYNLFTSRQ